MGFQHQQMTDHFVLPKGNHILRTKLIDPPQDIALHFHLDGVRETLAHTVWAFKKGNELATPHNALFTSAVAFGTHTDAKTKLFCESAAEHNIPIELFDGGKTFTTFFAHKIKHFLGMLHEWKARGIEYIFSLDSRDIVFRHPVDIILGKFNAIYDGRLIISKDMAGVAHPLQAVRDTTTHIWVSVHHDKPKMLEIIDANIAKWHSAGLQVERNLFTTLWQKIYRLEGTKPVPFNSDPKTAYDRCKTQRNCITLLDNHLYMCPQAALFQYAYHNGYVGEEWKLAADYIGRCHRRLLGEK